MYTQLLNLITKQPATCVKRNIDGACIPFDPANTDYQAFTRWLNDGNIPLPADEGENNGEINT